MVNQELIWLATVNWEAIWGKNWGLCLAKLVGKTKSFRRVLTKDGKTHHEAYVVDETACVELTPSSL